MSYTPFYNPWNDGINGGTPITAAALNHIEAGIVAASNSNSAPAQAAQYAPIGTNNATTDTVNLQNAITAAQAVGADLIIPSGVPYKISTGLVWDLSHGSLRTAGPVDIGCSTMTSGAALTLTANASAGPSNYYQHRAATNSVSGLRFTGPATDTAVVDGILIADTGIGLDQGTLRNIIVDGFRDGLTYGNNVWSIDHQRIGIAHSHRYGINLTMGTIAGECMTFTGVSIYGTHNATNTGAAVYIPTSGVDARFFGGSLDYNDIEGVFLGGNASFTATHIEDNGTGPMFQYGSTTGGADTNIMFRDCAWDVSSGSLRDHVHEILASTRNRISVMFDGGTGGVYNTAGPQWVVDNSGDTALGVQVNYRNFNVNIGGGGNNILLLGDTANLLYNGYFTDSTSFVSGGVLGWTAGTGNTWSIGTGGRGSTNALKVIGTGAANDSTTQKVAVIPGQSLRISNYISVPSYTSGSVGTLIQFYAVDGTTPVLTGLRIGSAVSALQSTWVGGSRIIRVPRGAYFMTIQLNCANLKGTAYWDNVEVIPS